MPSPHRCEDGNLHVVGIGVSSVGVNRRKGLQDSRIAGRQAHRGRGRVGPIPYPEESPVDGHCVTRRYAIFAALMPASPGRAARTARFRDCSTCMTAWVHPTYVCVADVGQKSYGQETSPSAVGSGVAGEEGESAQGRSCRVVEDFNVCGA